MKSNYPDPRTEEQKALEEELNNSLTEDDFNREPIQPEDCNWSG